MNFIGFNFYYARKGETRKMFQMTKKQTESKLVEGGTYWMINWNVLFSIERVSYFIHER